MVMAPLPMSISDRCGKSICINIIISGAHAGAKTIDLSGYGGDWRLPTIKELCSLIVFNGTNPNAASIKGNGHTPVLDTRYFDYG
jgi:hypothetical protein